MEGPVGAPQIARWQQWLEVIDQEVFALASNRNLYQSIIRIIQSNPRLPQTHSVYDWLGSGHVSSATMALRRVLDRDPDSISLVRLLREIIAAPTVITRAWFVAQYEGFPWANKDFDQFDPNSSGHVDADVIRADLKQLLATRSKVGRWCNKFMAHRDEKVALKQTAQPPILTWAEVDAAVELVGTTLTKYQLLLNQKGLLAYVAIEFDSLEEVFSVPWIVTGAALRWVRSVHASGKAGVSIS